MGQILTKYNAGAEGYAETADALFDPKSAFRHFVDFIDGVTTGPFTFTSIHTTTTGTGTLQDAAGGVMLITHAATSVANDSVVIGTNKDCVTLGTNINIYFETRMKFSAISGQAWACGVTTDAPGTSEFTASQIVPGTGTHNAILVGYDSGTDSITGAVSGKSWQLSTYNGTSAVETLIPLTFTPAVDTYYRVGFVVRGYSVQVYVDGKKCGPATSIVAPATPTAMGVYIASCCTATTPRPMSIDYFDISATR